MAHTESIQFRQVPREVRRVTAAMLEAESRQRRETEARESYERGRREGEKALSEQLLRQRSDLIELQNGVLESLRKNVQSVVTESQDTLVALTLEIAQKLVGSLPITAEMVEGAVREAMDQIEQTTQIKVLLHPEDLALLQKVNSGLLTENTGPTGVQLQASHEVTRGGCLVDTGFGRIDGRRETKLEMLRKTLQG